MNATVRLSSKYQVVIPRAAREALGLKAGDELLVLVKSDRVVMMPQAEKICRAYRRFASRRVAGSRSLLKRRTGFVVIPQVLRQHQRVLIDTGVWIYHFEQHPEFGRAAGIVIQSLEDGWFRGAASEPLCSN